MYRKQFLKFIILIIVLIFTFALGGCVYSNNKNYDELSESEKQHVKESFEEVKEEINTEFAEDTIIHKKAMDILENVEEKIVTE